MAGTVCFHHKRKGGGGRLHVGWRLRGYAPIWYEPFVEGDDLEGEDEKMKTSIGLYAKSEGAGDDIMPGEVKWHPWYEVTPGESSIKAERQIIQKQDLECFYEYLMEKDERRIARLEKALDDPGKARRYAFLKEARKWKKKDMKKRKAKADKEGKNPWDVVLTEDEEDEDEDEGFEADEEEVAERMAERKAERKRKIDEKMMPPPSSKRGRRGNASARGRAGNFGRGGRRLGGEHNDLDDPTLMSGGRGVRASPSPSPSERSRDSREDSMFDLSDPEARTSQHNVADYFTPFLSRGNDTNYVHPTVETVSDSGDDGPGARRRRAGSLNGSGIDEEGDGESPMRQTSAQRGDHRDLARFGREFGGGSGSTTGSNHKQANWEGYNNGMSEQEALASALRASEAPEDRGRDPGMPSQSQWERILAGDFPTPLTQDRGPAGTIQHESDVDKGLGENADEDGEGGVDINDAIGAETNGERQGDGDGDGDGDGGFDINNAGAAGGNGQGRGGGTDYGSGADGEGEGEGDGEAEDGKVKGENEE